MSVNRPMCDVRHTTLKSVLLSASPGMRLAKRVEPPAALPLESKNSWPVALL